MAEQPSIQRPLGATPYAGFANLMVAYPHFTDWEALYTAAGATKSTRLKHELYADMRRRHERTTTEQLDLVAKRFVGNAVLRDIAGKPEHAVHIVPFDFLPRGPKYWDLETVAAARPSRMVDATTSAAKLCRKAGRGAHVCTPGTGAGSAVVLFFTASRVDEPDVTADETLLHELFHAARLVRGVFHMFDMQGGSKNQEEFLANTVENMYRSELKRTQLLDDEGTPINPSKFLDDPRLLPPPRVVLALMRSKQPGLFAELANIPPRVASFNPFKQVDAENKAALRRAAGR